MTIQLGVTLFKIAFWLYLFATGFYVVYLFKKDTGIGKIGTLLLAVGFVFHTGSLAVRWSVSGHPPFLSFYEYMLSVTWGAALVYLVAELITKNRTYGSFFVPLIEFFTLLTYRLPSHMESVMPALRSGWRVPHVGTAILAYSAFALAFVVAIMYLLRERAGDSETSFWGSRLPALKVLDQTVYRTIAFGFMMQTALVITGAVWAQFAWGRYWGWDPKETWSLITWLIYAAYLHTRVTMGWRGRKSAVVVIVGFLAVIFTFWGCNTLLSGLHSYAETK